MSSQHHQHNLIAKQIHPQLLTSLPKKTQEPTPLAQFQQAVLQIYDKRRSNQNGYERVISALEQMVEELLVKNECLIF